MTTVKCTQCGKTILSLDGVPCLCLNCTDNRNLLAILEYEISRVGCPVYEDFPLEVARADGYRDALLLLRSMLLHD